ncbi:MAG TPA: CYTH domain-containing protein [Chloroflexia bacterium]|nr:CYTH domain-containing protein [Chloroflexia bacterium]
MAYKEEIEKKFLVQKDKLPELSEGSHLQQGYLGFKPTIRVRTEEGPGEQRKAYITIKGSGMAGRDEFEYDIPFDEARQLLKLAQASLVNKTRYRLPLQSNPELEWEIDIYEGENEGLVTAELEMPSLDYQFEHPDWLDQDVTEDPSYKNAALAQRPFRSRTADNSDEQS